MSRVSAMNGFVATSEGIGPDMVRRCSKACSAHGICLSSPWWSSLSSIPAGWLRACGERVSRSSGFADPDEYVPDEPRAEADAPQRATLSYRLGRRSRRRR